MSQVYFLITIPGLEDLLKEEINLKCPSAQLKVHKGGIEVCESLEWVYQAHYLLKIPTRILMRIDHYKVRDFPKLYQKVAKFNWNEYLFHPEPELKITCQESRLFHTTKIEETIRQGLVERFKTQPLKEVWKKENLGPQEVYFRFVNDELTVSIDLSGESLHKRSQNVIKGEAPLRETIAAALVFDACRFQKFESLHDFMCGSGTILQEAQHFFSANKLRSYDFLNIPVFKRLGLKKVNSLDDRYFSYYGGSDIDKDMIEKTRNSLIGIDLKVEDFFDQKKLPENSLLLMNPPYNKRIKTDETLGDFINRVKAKIVNEIKPSSWGLLVPSDVQDLFRESEGSYQRISIRKFRNGGLSVVFVLYKNL